MRRYLIAACLLGGAQSFCFAQSNVGIGTSTPAYPITFANVLGDKLSLWGGTASNANHYGLGVQAALLQIFTPTSADDIAFGTGRSGAFTERMRITGNGRVGIGTSAPAFPVALNTAIAGGGFVHTLTSNGVVVGTFANLAGGWLQTFSNHPLFLAAFNGDAALTVATNKNIGIGTTSPSTTLDVNGTVRIRGGAPAAGRVLATDVTGLASWSDLPQKALTAKVQTAQPVPFTNSGAGVRIIFAVNPASINPSMEFNDFGSGLNNATGEFTVPTTGVYLIDADVALNFSDNASSISITSDYYLGIQKTNSSGSDFLDVTFLRSLPRLWNIEKVSAVAKLTAGDKISITLSHNLGTDFSTSGTTANVSNFDPNTYLSIVRLY